METRNVRVVDQVGKLIATAQVADEGSYYGGIIDLRDAPPGLRALYTEFEEIVDGQMFACLDDIQEKIGSLALKVVFDSDREVLIKDLQIFPSTGEMSFKLAEAPAIRTM